MQNSLAFKVIKVFVDFIIASQLIIECLDDCKTFFKKIKLLIKCISFISILIERNYEFLYGIISTVRERISRTNINDNEADGEHSFLKKNILPETSNEKLEFLNTIKNIYN